MITEPGIYDLPAAEYHADPIDGGSLNATTIKLLCLESPAHAFAQSPRINPDAVPREDAEHFDIGTVAHRLLLEGSTDGVVVIDAKDWRTNAAKEQRDAAYSAGKTPILAARWRDVEAMVTAARAFLARHADGGAEMFTGGEPERSLFWQEPDGVWCRARLDYLRPSRGGFRPHFLIDDYKTATTANPDAFTRSIFFLGYDIQAMWYRRGVRALCGVDSVFRFAVQESTPPYALSVIGLGPDAEVLAEKKILYALENWRACRALKHWPGYPERTCYASLPPAHEMYWLEKETRGIS